MTFFFFFSSRRRHTRSDRDWSSDVCSSDLAAQGLAEPVQRDVEAVAHLLDRCFGPERESHLLARATLGVAEEKQQQLPRLRRSPDERSGSLRDLQGTECPDRQVACTGSLFGRGDRGCLNDT